MKRVIGIFGVPRSGTSWLGQIFNSSEHTHFAYQPMFTEQFRNKVSAYSTEQEMRDYLMTIYDGQADFLSQQDGKEKAAALRFPKLSEKPDFFVFKEVMYLYMIPRFLRNISEMKVIYILRNPYAILQSWYNAPKEFYPEWDIEKEWLFAESKNWYLPERYYGYHRWKEAIALAHSLQKEFPKQVYIIRYEDLDENPKKSVEELFHFSGIPYGRQTETFIETSRSSTVQDPYSVFRRPEERSMNKKVLPDKVVRQINEDLSRFSLASEWYDAEQLFLKYLVSTVKK